MASLTPVISFYSISSFTIQVVIISVLRMFMPVVPRILKFFIFIFITSTLSIIIKYFISI
uniref:Uncharacterized protein n=1 Tax=Heterorhabditis bacteriophora TaxID=37862 RepID=A0A1I7WH28_HETBA